MEKYARQAIAEGCKHAEELVVTNDSELYRVLNLHYNRNNQIDVSLPYPFTFCGSVFPVVFFIGCDSVKYAWGGAGRKGGIHCISVIHKPFPIRQLLDSSKLNEFADDNFD